jgi:cytochrome o ubiquinol oxidase operon protein cyoD
MTHIPSQSEQGMGEKSLLIYVFGLILCIALSVAPYVAVKYFSDNKVSVLEIIYICAVVQFMVQLICFIRLQPVGNQGLMNVMSFLLTFIIILIVVAGSLWIMSNLDYNMMH